MAPRDFYVHLLKMYKCAEFHCSGTICREGLIVLLSMLVQTWFENGDLSELPCLHLKTNLKVFNHFIYHRATVVYEKTINIRKYLLTLHPSSPHSSLMKMRE